MLQGKKIAIIIAFREFRDEEYLIPKQILQSHGAKVITASSKTGKALGSLGGEAKVSVLIEDLEAGNYDAVLFVGGSGAQEYIDDDVCHRIARDVIKKDKILAAICIAPTILAEAGVLRGKKATVWSSPMDKIGVRILTKAGAIYQPDSIVVDGNIVTANGPLTAKEFTQTIIKLLTKT